MVKYLHLNACYDKNDNVENTAFLEALGTFPKSLEENPCLTTASIRLYSRNPEQDFQKTDKGKREEEKRGRRLIQRSN